MIETMRAGVYRGSRKVVPEDVPVPKISDGEVLIRIAACGICGTDVKKVLGEMANANHPYLETLTTVPQVETIFSTELKPVWAGQTTARDATKKIADQIQPLLAT